MATLHDNSATTLPGEIIDRRERSATERFFLELPESFSDPRHEPFERYAQEFCFYCSVRPGLTGLWQISGRNCTTYERRVALDCEYARTKSVRGDAMIILRAIPEVVRGTGS